MCNSLQDLYAKCLPSDYGYPLRFPEPSSTLPSSYKKDGLKIGDVGYVNGDGAFNVLFNVSFHSNHAVNQRHGDSLTFDPVGFEDYEVDVNHNAIPLGRSITSSGITQPRAQTLRRPGNYEFTPSSAKGAILILPDGATSFNLSAPTNERFRKLAMEEAFDWYQLAQETCGDNIKNGSLYLLTGFYKAQCWSLASFNDATVTEDRHIWVAPREGGSTAAGRVWQCTFGLDYRDGPGPGQYGTVNQTVFIRGFKIAVRDDVFGYLSQKPEVLSVPPVLPRKDPCGFVWWLIRLFCKINTPKRRRRANGVADVDRIPQLSQPFHPSDIITQYLLDKDPNALVAITHDSEWITLIEMGKLTPEELTQKDRVEEALLEHYLLDSQPQNSAVCLQGKSTKASNLVLPTSETSWYNKPFNSNFQVVITSIRAEDIVAGFGRMPVGFYVVVQFDDTKRRTENKPVRLHESIVEWDEKIQLPSEPSAKVQLSVCASFEFSPMLGTGEVLRTAEICVGDLVDNTRLIIFPATGGESVSPCSSLKMVMKRQPSHTSGGGSHHNVDFDWEESSDLARLTDQGHNALLRYRTDSRRESIADSVGFFESALATCPPDHHCYAAVLCNLAKAHFINSQLDPESMGLSASILYYRKALELRPTGHPDRVATLLHLTGVLLHHYGKYGYEEFPGEITKLALEVQESCSEDSHERRAVDLALQTHALYAAIISVSSVDIDELIPTLRQALQDTPRDYFDRLQRLTNLVLALWIRYELGGDLGDLGESIAMHEEAMQFTSCGLGSQRHTQLLNERINATSAGGSWKDTLLTAASFVIPRFSIYRILCERLEMVGQLVDAVECFHAMTNEPARETQVEEATREWIPAFKSRCCEKLEYLGDIAMNAQKHDDAISRYSVALSLDPVAPQGLFIKRSKMYIAKSSWEEALRDANEAISLDPASPWGYEGKYVALQRLGDYENAIDAYEVMLSKLAESADPDIRQHSDQYISPSGTRATIRKVVRRIIRHYPRVLINTATGRLHDKTEQASAFESLPIFHELVSSMTTCIDHARIKREVRQFFRYVMLSHKWEDNEPLFQQVVHVAVYDLEESPTHDKLQTFCRIVRDAGFIWAWSDTCCIDKSDHFVLQEALVAMFRWYQGSVLTIVYLRGVHSSSPRGALAGSIWNTRAWTLQEYVAAKVIHFYTEEWTLYLDLEIANHKESPEIISEMEAATGVSAERLMALRPGLTSIREKLRLASARRTTWAEDAAYTLLGIFSVAGVPAIYGEGEASLGRLLANILTRSGDVSILAWTGESSHFNSCLPARITVFNGSATSHLPLPIPDSEMERIINVSYSPLFDLDMALKLYDRLSELPTPRFAESRMSLPCIAFQLPYFSVYRTGSGRVYRADTVAFGMIEIKTRQDLSRMKTLYLIHPWLETILECEDVHGGAIIEDNVAPSPSLLTDSEESDDDASSFAELELPSHPVPVRMASMDKETRARRLDARLRQPFGALLVTLASTGRRTMDYRRVAADSLITVRFHENVSLADILDNVRVLDVM